MSLGGWCAPSVPGLPLDAVTWVVLDTETTGLDAARDELRELAALRIDASGRQLDVAAWRAVDGTSAQRSVIQRVVEWFDAGAVLVAHNIRFDVSFLEQIAGWQVPTRWLCTMRLSGGNASLDRLAGRLGVDIQHRHTAVGDATTLARIVLSLIERARDRGLQTVSGLAVVCPPIGPASATAPTGLTGWDGVRSLLDLVAPIRFIDRQPRRVLRAVVGWLPGGIAGPVGQDEQMRVVHALSRAGVSALALDLMLSELGVSNLAMSENSLSDT